ncbi:MAG: hypothetical protein AAF634_05025 [Bacteroidota bacterium]
MITSTSTTKAPTLKQLQHYRAKKLNNLLVPNLEQTPEKYHNLYLQISKCTSISCFTHVVKENEIMLRLTLRSGEICNQVVKAKIKNLFEGYKSNLQIHGRDIIVILKVNDVRG